MEHVLARAFSKVTDMSREKRPSPKGPLPPSPTAEHLEWLSSEEDLRTQTVKVGGPGP